MITITPLGRRVVVVLDPEPEPVTASGLVMVKGGRVDIGDEADRFDQQLERLARQGIPRAKLVELRHQFADATNDRQVYESSGSHLRWGRLEAIGEESHLVAGQRVLVNVLLGDEVDGRLVVPDRAVVASDA